jgi:hypothetical protein
MVIFLEIISNKYFEVKKKLISIFIEDSFDVIKKSDVVLFCADNDRSDKLNNKNYSRVLDTIYDDLISRGYGCINISLPFNIEVKDKSWGYVLSFNRSYFFAKIFEKISLIINKLLLKKNNNSKKYIIQYYDNILKLSKPKVIFVIGCVPELAIAARNNNILIVEPLHGFGYTKVPWKWSEFNKEYLPNIIICFDEISGNSFRELEKKDVRIYIINSMWLSRFKKENWYKLPEEWRLGSNKLNNNKKSILVSLTWGYAGDHGDKTEFRGILSNGLIPDSIIQIIENTQDNINWYFRLHPKHLRNKNKYAKHFNLLNKLKNNFKNVEWEISSLIPLPLMIETVSGVISMSSMVPYDAAKCGVKSLILCPTINDPDANPNFKDLISNNFAEYKDFKDQKSIYNWVLSVNRIENPGNFNISSENWENILEYIFK